jgi:hypothetical protein
MVKTVKLALVILLGMALVLTQGIAASGSTVSACCPVQKMSCCGKNKSCCNAKPAPESPQTPALPAPGGSDSQLQAAMTPPGSVLTLPNPVSTVPLSYSSSAISSGRVLLYQRNCAFLI